MAPPSHFAQHQESHQAIAHGAAKQGHEGFEHWQLGVQKPERGDILRIDTGGKGGEDLGLFRWYNKLVVAAALVHSRQ